MNQVIEKRFNEMGAELLLEKRNLEFGPRFTIDIRDEKFVIAGRDLSREDVKVLDIRPSERHLLLMWEEKNATGIQKHRFLCGHDERQWFVAAVPGSSVKNVPDAMEALKPEAVINRENRLRMSGREKVARHNPARKRQGEWFFVPIWNRLKVDPMRVFKNEPIVRGRGKPHKCEFLCRFGGEQVRVSSKYPNGITEVEYLALIKKNPSKKKLSWRTMVRDARVYARGRISHPDHATLDLGREWHEVLPNRENEAPSMRHMRFLD